MKNCFWRAPSTWLVTLIRVSILFGAQTGFSPGFDRSWWQSPSFTQILIRPSYSLAHVQEALAIRELGGGSFIGAYAARRIRLPPLLLAALMPLSTTKYAEVSLAMLCLLMDLLLAAMLESIARIALFTNRSELMDQESHEQELLPPAIQPNKCHVFATFKDSKGNKTLISMESLPLLVAQVYFWSPVVILSGSAYSCFQGLPGFLGIASIAEALRRGGSLPLSTFFLAMACYLELHYVVFLLPLLSFPIMTGRQSQLLFSYIFWFVCLQGLSYQLVGPKNLMKVIQATYGLGWNTIRPSLSVQWYFAMQLFSRFLGYFGTLILGLPYILPIPIAIRLYRYPIALVAIYSMLWTIFRPVQTLYDVNLSLCLLLLCPRSLARVGTPAFLALSSMAVPVILSVVDHWMWLGPNTGNANYMFFQCLAFNVFLGVILGQFCNGCLERDKARRLAAKERVESKEVL